MDVMTLAARLTLNTSEFNTGLTQSEKKMSKMSSGTITLGNLTTQAVNAAARATKKLVTDTVETGKEFDAAMSQVRAIKDMTDEEFGRVRQKAMDLGASTKFTASEVAEGLYYMGLAGWDVEEMLEGIGPMLDLAAASGENLGTTSDIVTDALTAFGLSAKDTQHFVDVLAAASANSNTTVSMMGQAFKYLATNAGVLNYSIDDVAVTLGLLANNGIKSSQAGTSMRQIINSLIAPTDKAAAAMENLGIHLFEAGTDKVKPLNQVLTEMREVFKNSDFNLAGKPLEEVQAQMDEVDAWYDDLKTKIEEGGGTATDSITGSLFKMDDLEKEYKSRLQAITGFNEEFLGNLSAIGGLRGIGSILAIMKSTDEDFYQLIDAVENSEGAASKMSGTMLDNLQGDITILNSALEGLKIMVSDSFKNDLRSFVSTFTEEVGKMNEAFQKDGLLGLFTSLADWVINGITDALTNAEVTGEGASKFGEALGDFVGRTVKHLVEKAPELISGLFNAGINLAGGLIEGLFSGLFGTGEGTVPGMILGAEQMEEDAIKQAAKSSTQAKGILEYMDSLKEQYGDAAENTEEWVTALERLKEVYPQINQFIAEEGGNLSATNQNLIEYIENENKRIVQEAKRKALQTYIDAYSEKEQELTSRRIEREIALAEQKQARKDLISYVAGYEEGYTGEGYSFKQIEDAARALAVEYGDSQTQIDALSKAYNDATSTVNSSSGDIESLAQEALILKGAMESAERALANLESSAGSYTSYGEWANNYYGGRAGHAKGLWSVPYDDYAANLHRGEMVLTASQARDYRDGNGNVDISAMEDRIVAAIRAGMENATVRSYLNGQDITDEVNRNNTRTLKARRFNA